MADEVRREQIEIEKARRLEERDRLGLDDVFSGAGDIGDGSILGKFSVHHVIESIPEFRTLGPAVDAAGSLAAGGLKATLEAASGAVDSLMGRSSDKENAPSPGNIPGNPASGRIRR